MQGATDESKTQFSVVHSKDEKFNIFALNTKNEKLAPDKIELIERENSSKIITKIYFSGLKLNEDYRLVLEDKLTKKNVTERIFNTLDVDKKNLKFVVCSCMIESQHKPQIWREMVEEKPDLIFFIGDSVYADYYVANPKAPMSEILWQRFTEVRAVLDIYFSKRLVPIMATWDDHDFGLNNATSKVDFVEVSQKNFLSFFAQEASFCRQMKKGPGVSSAFYFDRQLFILLDDRSYRLEAGSQDRFAHWGEKQEKWVLELIKNHDGFVWLMNGSQFFTDKGWHKKESVARDHTTQLKGFLEELKKTEKKIIFVSGDVHYSEVSKIEPDRLGYLTYEITSSGLHSLCAPWFPYFAFNNRRIESTGDRNYVLIETEVLQNSEKKSKELSVKIKSMTFDKKTSFSVDIKI